MGLTKTLICIELPGQVGLALKEVNRRSLSHYVLLALTPHVEYALEKLGYAYHRPEDYHSEEDINTVGLADLSRLEGFCAAIDDLLQSRWDQLKEHGLRPASLNWYHLKILLNSVSVRAFILRRILEAEGPQLVLYFGTRAEPVPRELFFVRESAWARMVPLASNALGIPHEALGGRCDPSVLNRCASVRRGGLKGELKARARRLLGNSAWRLLRARYARARLGIRWPHLRAPKRSLTPRPTLLALERAYSLGLLLDYIQPKECFNILHWDVRRSLPARYLDPPRVVKDGRTQGSTPGKKASREQGRRLWADARGSPELRQFLYLSGIDCFPVVERRLQRFFEINIPELASVYLKARSLLRAERPCAVLAAAMGDYRCQVVAIAAKNEGVPFVVYRHGDSSACVSMESWLNEINEHNDFRHAGYVLVFGQGDARYFERSRGKQVKVVPVGSATLDQLRRPVSSSARARLLRKFGLRPERKTVMYVPTNMDGNIRVAPYHERSPSRIYEMQRRLVGAFSEFPEIQFVLKLPDGPLYPFSPIADLVRDRQLKNCVVITDPLTSVLPMADLFVTDTPTTAFLEMLATQRPVLFCGYQMAKPCDPHRWDPSRLEMWQERVAYSEDLEEFLELLRSYLREERFEPVSSQDTLLKLFGTHLDDGKSVERAHAFLETLARREPRLATEAQRR